MVLDDWYKDTQYAIGLTANSLALLRNLNIPPPDQVVFGPASVYQVRGDLSRVGNGFPQASWVWDVLSTTTLYQLLAFLGGADYKELYIRTDRRDASEAVPERMFDTYSCVMWKPLLFGDEGVSVARSPYALQSVQIQFKKLVIVS